MILTIVLLWVLGVGVLICFAVIRGRKKGAQKRKEPAADKSDSERVLHELHLLKVQMSEIDRKLSAKVEFGSESVPSVQFSESVIAKSISDDLDQYVSLNAVTQLSLRDMFTSYEQSRDPGVIAAQVVGAPAMVVAGGLDILGKYKASSLKYVGGPAAASKISSRQADDPKPA